MENHQSEVNGENASLKISYQLNQSDSLNLSVSDLDCEEIKINLPHQVEQQM